MAVNTNALVLGSDGHAPQYDPDGRWTTWNYNELYLGENGLRKYVPKVGDWVQDTDSYQRYTVTFVDPMTLIPVLQKTDGENYSDNSDLLVGSSSDTYRVYLDTSVTPYILAVDTRLKWAGSMSQYAKIFRGGSLGEDGRIVSFLYDSQGNYLTDRIPLELAAVDPYTNNTIKTITVCHTNERMRDGERVVAVIYNDQGHVVSKRALIVENTSFIRDIAAGTKYISHISLDSPFLSQSNPQLLEYPINVPIQAFNMFGIVHYSDGSTIKLPIDNNKFRLYGLDSFIASVPGQGEVKLGLSYSLAANEVAYGAVSGDGKYITAPYSLITTVQNGAYTVKLYVYPVWNTHINGYVLRWFMMDLNRDILFDVTPYIYFNNSSDVFDPTGYNKVQNLSVRINLKDVSAGMKSYIHTQNVAVVLKSDGASSSTRWLVGYDPNQNPFYGNDLFATVQMINQNLWRVNVKNGRTNISEWLKDVYLNTKPLTDKKKEIAPLSPTHMVFVYGNSRTEYPITDWDIDLQVNGDLDVQGTIQIEFIKRTTSGDLRLGISGLAIKEA